MTLIPKIKTKKEKPSHQEKVLPMSSGNSTANSMQNDNKTAKNKSLKKCRSEQAKNMTKVLGQELRTYQGSENKEVQAATDSLKKRTAGDSNGIKAEDIKACDEETRGLMREIFNGVLRHEDITPEVWRGKKYK